MAKRNSPTSPSNDRNASISLRVRYAETDQMRVVHHANYFVWFELARSEFCRMYAIDYIEMEASGLFLPVVEAHCRYRTPARYDDEITVTTYVLEQTRRTLRMGYVVARGDTRLAEGETLQMLVDGEGKPRIFPPDLAARFTATDATL